jgi:hypothetical protein
MTIPSHRFQQRALNISLTYFLKNCRLQKSTAQASSLASGYQKLREKGCSERSMLEKFDYTLKPVSITWSLKLTL